MKDFSGSLDGAPYNKRQIQIIVVTSILVFLSTFAVVLRLVARKLQNVRLYKDDYAIIVGLLLSYGSCICQYVGVAFGLGRHVSEVGHYNEERYLVVLFVLQMFWNITLPVIKLSITLFYRRIFPVPSMKLSCKIVDWYLLLWFIAFQTTAIFQCTPVDFFWIKTIEGGHCIESTKFFIALATTNLFTDVALLILPIPYIWELKISNAQKLRLSSIFLVGTFICVIAIVRINGLTQIDDHDITFSNAFAGLFTAIESSIAVVVVCMPSMMPIWNLLIGRSPLKNHSTGRSEEAYARGTYQSRVRAAANSDGWEMLTTVAARDSGSKGDDISKDDGHVITVRQEWDVRREEGDSL